MKIVRIVKSSFIVPSGYAGITIFPFIFVSKHKHKQNNKLINHEKIHIQQQIEMLVIPFFIWYILEFFIKLAKYKTWQTAYREISFEREAFANEKNLDYLKNRKRYEWIKLVYFRTKNK